MFFKENRTFLLAFFGIACVTFLTAIGKTIDWQAMATFIGAISAYAYRATMRDKGNNVVTPDNT